MLERRRHRRLWLAVCTLGLLALHAPGAHAERGSLAVQEARPLLRRVPDVAVNLPDGDTVQLSALWAEKPLLLTFFYQQCTGTCSPFLRSLKAATDSAGGLGEDYHIVSLSFDARDTPERVGWLGDTLGVRAPGQWQLGTSTPAEIRALARAAGFWWEPIADSEQFDHPSMIIAIRDGQIVRVLLGNTVSHRRFREMLADLGGVRAPFYINPEVDTPFRCLEVDPQTGEVSIGWGMLMILVPGVFALVSILVLFGPSAAPRR